MKIVDICRDFASSTLLSTGVDDLRVVAPAGNAEPEGAALSISACTFGYVENLASRQVVYTRGSPAPEPRETT
jgi:hypothetical protein